MQFSTLLSVVLTTVNAIDLNPINKTSIMNAQNIVLKGMLVYCPWIRNVSGATPGVFQAPYYWWEAGVAWGMMIDWSTYTGNHTYDRWVKQAIQIQSGKNWNFMTSNQTSVEGNDDQAFWGITAMNAAEKNFTKPDDGYPPWLYFAQATFNTMANRWSDANCNGGLRWQIFTWNAGYDYKNMVSNGCLFHLAARLGRFTNNETYIDWAEKVWNWSEEIKFLNALNPNDTNLMNRQLRVFDGAHTTDNCSNISKSEWTYDQGLMISGCAYLYNYTGDTKWLNRSLELWGRVAQGGFMGNNKAGWFTGNKILYEPSCMTANESIVQCTNDQRCFKGITLSFFGNAMKICSELKEQMWDYIKFSSQGAAWSCSGGTDGVTCGLSWLRQGWDGYYGVGEQMCAFAAFNTLLYEDYPGPYKASDLPEIYKVTSSNTSTSEGGGKVYGWGANAGLNTSEVKAYQLDIGTGDKAGAGILTAIVIIIIIVCSAWLLF